MKRPEIPGHGGRGFHRVPSLSETAYRRAMMWWASIVSPTIIPGR